MTPVMFALCSCRTILIWRHTYLKKIFFPNTTEQKVYFRPTTDLTESQRRVLDEFKWDKVRLSGKQN